MKIELEIDDIEKIAVKVVESLKPLLSNSHDSNDNELMDVKGLAGYLKVKKTWVYEKIHKKEIPFHRACKFPRFRKKHVDLWLLNPYHPNLSEYNLNYRKEVKNNERIV